MKEVFDDIERIHECEIHDGHATYICDEKLGPKSRKIGCMDEHIDKPYDWKPLFRLVLTIGRSNSGKVMRFTDIKYGRWVDIPIDHGTCIRIDPIFSGTETGRYIHGVRGAEGTYTIVLDFGRTPAGVVEMHAHFLEGSNY